ncbi:MAG TPA: hypothetical protein VOB72_19830, partial [Candidatus Dormibacteraeota bacterium]|nr:hypothetical protein [Candidatus Dormibacteraeota bacterium]
VVGAVLIHRSNGGGLKITPTTMFLLYYLTFVYIGSALLVWDRGEGAYFHIAGSRNYVLLATVGLAPLVFACGVWLANRWTRFRPDAELTAHWQSGWSDPPPARAFTLRFVVLTAACVAVSVAVVAFGPTPPLFYLLTHPGSGTLAFDLSLHDVRLSYLSQHAGGLPFQATLYQFYGNIMPLLSIIALAQWLRVRSRRWLLAGLALLAGSFLMAALTLTKNPVENLLVLLIVAWLWWRHRNLGPWQVSAMAGVALGAFFTLVVATNRSVPLGNILVSTVRRLFVVQAQVLYSIFDLVPARVGFLGGGAFWMDVRNLRPGPKSTLDFGGWLYTMIVSGGTKLDAGVGSAPTAFFGQLYADFGVIAALAGMLVVGCLAQLVYVRYLRHGRTVVAWAVFVGLTVSIPRLTTSSLISIGVQYGIAASILLGIYFADWSDLVRRLRSWRPRRSPQPVAQPDHGVG